MIANFEEFTATYTFRPQHAQPNQTVPSRKKNIDIRKQLVFENFQHSPRYITTCIRRGCNYREMFFADTQWPAAINHHDEGIKSPASITKDKKSTMTNFGNDKSPRSTLYYAKLSCCFFAVFCRRWWVAGGHFGCIGSMRFYFGSVFFFFS